MKHNICLASYFDAAGDGVLFGDGFGAGDGERLRPMGMDGEGGRCRPDKVNVFSCLFFVFFPP